MRNKMRLYQVQLETSKYIYSFEVGTNDYDAAEIAEYYLRVEFEDPDHFDVTTCHPIGKCEQWGVLKAKRFPEENINENLRNF